MVKRSLFVAVIFLWCSAFACNGYHNAVLAEHDFELSVKAAQQIEEAEFQAGHLSASEHANFQTIILQVAQGGKGVAGLLQANASKQTVLAEISLVDNTIQQAIQSGAASIKNPTTKQNLVAALQAADAIVKNLETFVGGGK